MKKHLNLLLTGAVLISSPLVALTSCGNHKELLYTCETNNSKYFASEIQIGDIYSNREINISFKLNENCYLDFSNSYFKISGHRSYSFDSPYIKKSISVKTKTWTITVDKDLVKEGHAFIYISAYKEVNYSNSDSSEDFEFFDNLTSWPIENEDFTVAFKVKNNKAIDLSNSTITVGTQTIDRDKLYIYDATVLSESYTFLTIPALLVKGDISLKLNANTALNVTSTSYPEYTVRHLSKIAPNNDFYMYFTLADAESYDLDKDNAVIKVGETKLTPDQYEFSTYLETISCLKIPAAQVTGNISVDVPVAECYTLYANKPGEYATVEVDGKKIIKNKEYSFKVTALDGKEIQWDNAYTYILVGEEKLTKANGDFTISAKDPETGAYTVTVKADKAKGDMYCHFITQ